MQKIFYYVVARNPLDQRRVAVVGLSTGDAEWLKTLFPFVQQGSRLRLAIPDEHRALVHRRLFGEGIPAACTYTLYRVLQPKKKNPTS